MFTILIILYFYFWFSIINTKFEIPRSIHHSLKFFSFKNFNIDKTYFNIDLSYFINVVMVFVVATQGNYSSKPKSIREENLRKKSIFMYACRFFFYLINVKTFFLVTYMIHGNIFSALKIKFLKKVLIVEYLCIQYIHPPLK